MQQFQSNILQNKSEIRKYCKNRRQEIFNSDRLDRISKQIVENILNSAVFKSAKNVMLFYPFGKEINLLPLLNVKDKNFYFPKCKEKEILCCPNCDEYDENKFGIKEPKSAPLADLSILDLILVPALCADLNCQRIGYGGGFYDRFLSKGELGAKRAIVISNDFLFEKLPAEKFDVPCDLIFLPDFIYEIGTNT